MTDPLAPREASAMRMKERKSVKRRYRVAVALAVGLLLATVVAETAAMGAARGRASGDEP